MTLGLALKRGFLGRCPNCGEGHLFRAFVKVADHCEKCGEPFRYHRVNMTSLHSRPIMGQPWRYQFYIEIDGHRADGEVLRALRDVGERSVFLETLGSYPVWRDPS